MAQTFSSDKFTSIARKTEFYSDFTVDLDIHPGKKDLSRITNEESVKRSIKNLILTNTGERPFQPALGSNISRLLFELADNDSLDLAQDQILNTIRVHEPRARVLKVVASASPDTNSISLTISFSLINSERQSQVNLLLYRVR